MDIWKNTFAPDDQALLCLTTLRHRRYVDDAVQIVGLPAGARIRLRYRKKYVSDELWNLASSGGPLPKFKVLVILAGSARGRENLFRPLRVGTVTETQCAGNLLVLDVSLGDYAPDCSPPDTVWREVSALARDLPTIFDSTAASDGKYVQILSNVPNSVTTSSSVDMWEKVARGFFEVDGLGVEKGWPFCVPYLFMVDGLSVGIKRRLHESGRLSIEAGSRLDWQIHTMARPGLGILRNPVGEVQLDLSHSSAKLLTSRRVRVDSSRDVRPMTISAQPLFRPAYGHLSVRAIIFEYPDGEKNIHEQKSSLWVAAGKREEIVVSRFDLPLRVGRLMPVLAALAAGSAAGFVALDDEIQSTLHGQYWVPVATGLLVFLSLYLGFNREETS